MLDSLFAQLRRAQANADVRAIVLTGAGGAFVDVSCRPTPARLLAGRAAAAGGAPHASFGAPARPSIAAGAFSAGFDFKLFGSPAMESVLAKRQDAVRELAALLEGGAKPTVAAVAGACLGGGCELAMACNARVCAEGTPAFAGGQAGRWHSSSWSAAFAHRHTHALAVPTDTRSPPTHALQAPPWACPRPGWA